MLRLARQQDFARRAYKYSKSVNMRRLLSSNHYNTYNYYQPPKSSFGKKFLYMMGIGGVVGGICYYFYWPKHTFPSSVAKILRKGLWAESDKGELDFQLALKHYIEALQECDKLGMDKLSDEYTGIQLKIAEMFERLGMMDDADFVYNEIGTLYLSVLTAPPNSPEGRRIKNEAHRGHIIQKDLRIAVKLAMLQSENPNLSKAILVTHLMIAKDLVERRLGLAYSAKKVLTSEEKEPQTALEKKIKAMPDFAPVGGHVTSFFSVNDGTIGQIKTNPMAWEPFCIEFFSAMDLLMVTCLKMNDIKMAATVKKAANEWGMLAELKPSQLMLSSCNLAALLYIEAGAYEDQIYQLKKIESRSPPEEKKYQEAIAARESSVKTSLLMYEGLVDYSKQLPAEVLKEDKEIGEIVAMAIYGMGVINLHEGNLDNGERLLREARVRSKKCGYESMITPIENELEKLFKERKKLVQLEKGSKDAVQDKTSQEKLSENQQQA